VGGGGGRGGGGRGRGGASGATADAQSGLYSVGIDGRDRRRLAAGTFAGVQPTADRRAVFFRGAVREANADDAPPPGRGGRGGGEVGFPIERLAIGAGGGGGGAAAADGGGGGGGRATGGTPGQQVNFAFNVRVDRRDEWKQILDESYRVMKYRYYDPTMHGKDWASIYARYSPLLADVGTNEDVYDLANAMIGELSTSHTGVSGPTSANV